MKVGVERGLITLPKENDKFDGEPQLGDDKGSDKGYPSNTGSNPGSDGSTI